LAVAQKLVGGSKTDAAPPTPIWKCEKLADLREGVSSAMVVAAVARGSGGSQAAALGM
jgi:hypothetical protein